MNEIVDITTFLTKQNIYPDMQKEILSYYDQEIYIDILKIQTKQFSNHPYHIYYEGKFKHKPNRRNYYGVLKQLFRIVKQNAKNNYMVYVKNECVKIERFGKFEIFKYYQLEQHLKNKTFTEAVFPFIRVLNLHYVKVDFYTKKLKEI